MKVWELFETYDPKLKYVIGDKWTNYDPKEIKEALERVLESKEYKEVLKFCTLDSSKVQLSHGMLSLRINNDLVNYEVDISGNIRFSDKSETGSSRMRLSVDKPDRDLYIRYINCLKEVLTKIGRRKKAGVSVNVRSPHDEFNLDDLDLSGVKINATFENQSLTSIEGLPDKLTGSFSIEKNKKVLSLKGCPKTIKNQFLIIDTEITDLEYFPVDIGNIGFIGINNLKDLTGITKRLKSCSEISFRNCPNIKIGGLGLLKVEGLTDIECANVGSDTERAFAIIRKHMKDKNLRKCKLELEEAGLQGYAKL